MAERIDLEEVLRSCAAMHERYLETSERPGEEGALSRLGADCDTVMTIWRAKEANRRTDPNDVINALIVAIVAHIAGEVLNHANDENKRIAAAVSIGSAFTQTLFETMAASAAGAFKTESIPARQVGLA
ncbi:MAG: hypothetical protein WC807_14605 [Hyphomicrobium sp.]|jgi:hypothetical protein